MTRTHFLGHVFVLNESNLRPLLREYVDYYNEQRRHTSIGDAPVGRPVESRALESCTRHRIAACLGGLHHRYIWREAA